MTAKAYLPRMLRAVRQVWLISAHSTGEINSDYKDDQVQTTFMKLYLIYKVLRIDFYSVHTTVPHVLPSIYGYILTPYTNSCLLLYQWTLTELLVTVLFIE